MARFEGADLNIRCREVADFTEKAISDNDLEKVLRDISNAVGCYAFKSRAKRSNGIFKKVERKRTEGKTLLEKLKNNTPQTTLKSGRRRSTDRATRDLRREANKLRNYDPDHVTDAWGCRFVTLYQSEIPVVVGALLASLSAFNTSLSGLANAREGAPVQLREFVIYTNRPEKDPLSIVDATMEALKNSGFVANTSTVRPPENRKSAYSSVHLIFDRDVYIENVGNEQSTEPELATFEIQVRDIFEEGWGEVQHDLLYSEKDTVAPSPSQPDGGEDTTWRLHLNALKTFVDGCSQHASIIRRHFDVSKRGPTPTNVTQSATDRDKDRAMIIQALKRHGVISSVRGAVSRGYTLFDSGERAISPKDKSSLLLAASTAFSEGLKPLTQRTRREKVRPECERTVEYYLLMEQANSKAAAIDALAEMPRYKRTDFEIGCLEDVRSAYAKAVESCPSDPMAHIRLGRIIEKLGDGATTLESALEVIQRGIDLVAGDPVTGTNHWIAISSRIKKSYILWLKSLRQEDEAAMLDIQYEAARANLEAIAIWKAQEEVARRSEPNRLQAHKAASNVLYFGGNLLLAGRTYLDLDDEVLRRHMQIISDLKIDSYSDYYKTRDNLIHAHLALGNQKEACQLAAVNFLELRTVAEQRHELPLDMTSVPAHLRGAEVRCFETARKVLFDPKAG